jgi:glycerol-3-phosphate dehydrogenase
VLFIIPWDEHWIIGTTDTDWTLDLAHPAATSADIDYLLDTVNAVLVQPLSRDDIDGVYAGLRPLISGDEGDATTKALPRACRGQPRARSGARRGWQVRPTA